MFRILCLLTMLIIFSQSLMANDLFIRKGYLSNKWAQELIGSDLAKNELIKFSHLTQKVPFITLENVDIREISDSSLSPLYQKYKHSPDEEETLSAIGNLFDYDKRPFSIQSDHHGTLVMNLIVNKEVGTTDLGELSFSKPIDEPYNENILNESSFLLASSSATFHESALNIFKKKGVPFVASAGNSYSTLSPDFSSYHDLADANENIILVGNITPIGLPDYHSAYTEKVFISAPSSGGSPLNSMIQSSYKGDFVSFSGTSGAQPLVSGSIINVMAILKGITPLELKELIRKTALPTPNSKDLLRQDGAGTINAYSLVAVSLRLKIGGWPNNRQIIFGTDLYNFQSDAEKLFNKWKVNQDLNTLRKAVLLVPTNPEYNLALVNFYNQQGQYLMAAFYSSLIGEQDFEKMLSYLDHPLYGMSFKLEFIRSLGSSGSSSKSKEERKEWILSQMKLIKIDEESSEDDIVSYFAYLYALGRCSDSELSKRYFLEYLLTLSKYERYSIIFEYIFAGPERGYFATVKETIDFFKLKQATVPAFILKLNKAAQTP